MNELESAIGCDPSGAESYGADVTDRRDAELESTLEDILPNVMKRFCPACGEPVAQNATGRPRKFCSTECCNVWWRKHPKPEHWASAQRKVCPVCGTEFLSGKEAWSTSTFCMRAMKGGDLIPQSLTRH